MTAENPSPLTQTGETASTGIGETGTAGNTASQPQSPLIGSEPPRDPEPARDPEPPRDPEPARDPEPPRDPEPEPEGRNNTAGMPIADTRESDDRDLAARVRDLENMLAAARAGNPLSLVPFHGGGEGTDIAETWSLADQEAARGL